MVTLAHRRKHYALWVPTRLGAALQAWIEGTSFSSVDGTAIATWPDLSGNGRNWTQASGTLQPTQQTHSGVRVARFDATNDGMLGSLNLASNPFTIVAAYRVASTASASRRAIQGNTSNWLMGPYTGTYKVFDGRGFIPSSVGITTNFAIHSLSQFSGSTPDSTHWVNGSSSGSVTYAGAIESFAPGLLNLGASGVFSEPLNGDFYALIAINNANTDSRQKAEGYLAWKLGIQSSLDASHPYRNTRP